MEEQQLRIDLAAVFRLFSKMDMHESVANHLSAAVSEDGKKFIMNRRWMHFDNVTASNLQLLDSENKALMSTSEAPDPSAWAIHGNVHRRLPKAKVVLHLHPSYATALSTLIDPRILPLDNNTARFYKRIAYDTNFSGLATSDHEGSRIANAFLDMQVLMMGNHGVSVIGETIAEAFESMYYLEKACKTMMLAYATGQPLNILNDSVAEKTAASWKDFTGMAEAHFAQLKVMLDKTDPDYKD
jgi:ribulose-5-phosphate 4-epimerase/fuculose-1-phosphate aldolase